MTKHALFTLGLSLMIVWGFAQDSVLDAEDPKDSMNYNKVMIIPFNPDLYFSDSDHDLAKYNRRHIPEIRRMFRYGLDFNLNVRILSMYDTEQLLQDTASDAQKDLEAIYKGVSYHYEKSVLAPDEKKPNLFERMEDRIKHMEETDDSEAAQKASAYKDDPYKPKKFMNVIPHSPDMFEYLEEKYETDLFLFINQFELKTNYEECLDRANKVFQRELLVHYTIFNKEGEQLAGDVVTIKFPSNTNDMDRIIRSNFPMISDHIAGKLPKPRKKPGFDNDAVSKTYEDQ